MNEYMGGDICNLVLYQPEGKVGDDNLSDFPPEMVDLANKLMKPWTHFEKTRFTKLPEAMREAEFKRLTKKYARRV